MMWVLYGVFLLTTIISFHNCIDLRDYYMKFTCSKGELFKLDCNVCMCDAETERYVVCSTYRCRTRPKLCKPFASYVKGCNNCSCQFGGLEFCTLKQCSKES